MQASSLFLCAAPTRGASADAQAAEAPGHGAVNEERGLYSQYSERVEA